MNRAWTRTESLLDTHGPHDEDGDEVEEEEDDDELLDSSVTHPNNNTQNSTKKSHGGGVNLHGIVPVRYLQDPLRAHPSLDTLRAAIPAQEDSAGVSVSMSSNLSSSMNAASTGGKTFKSPPSSNRVRENNRSISTSTAASGGGTAAIPPTTTLKQVSLSKLLFAADQDAFLHTLRKRAVLEKNPSLLDINYTRESDTVWMQRQGRLETLTHHIQSLQDETLSIMKQLEQMHIQENSSSNNKLRSKTSTLSTTSTSSSFGSGNTIWMDQVRQSIQKWERAMDLYVYCATTDPFLSTVTSSSKNMMMSLHEGAQSHLLTMYQLLDKLVVATSSQTTTTTSTTTSPEQVLSHILTETTQLAESMLQNISQLAQDATIHLMEAQDSFRIRLDAHAYVAHKAVEHVQYQVQETFLAQGKEAVLIGRALQVSEAQLRQCEYATLLLQHWWTLETLAQQEIVNQNMLDSIKVLEEVRGLVPMNNCKLDPIFTQPQYSLEASRILKSLRYIVRQGGSGTNAMGGSAIRHPTLSPNLGIDDTTILEGDDIPLDSNVQSSATTTAGDSSTTTSTTNLKNLPKKGGVDKKDDDNGKTQSSPSTATAATIMTSVLDPKAGKRFDLTHNLIQRVSSAMEQRLLNTFSEIYTRGGSYDFSSIQVAWKYQVSSKSTPSLDWMTLRDVAEALMNFDQGRSLHKRYLSLVISTKFPELFLENRKNRKSIHTRIEKDDEEDEDNDEEDSDEDENEVDKRQKSISKTESDMSGQSEFDMDDMRTQLATLFHRVSEVCGLEFQLIAHIFSPSLPMNLEYERRSFQHRSASRTGKVFNMGRNGNTPQSCFPENFPLTIARSLIRHIISDPVSGMQARIDQLLDMIDKKGGDFDAVAKKLDTFVVIHEKAAGLFSLLRESAMKMWGVDRVRLPDATIDGDTEKRQDTC